MNCSAIRYWRIAPLVVVVLLLVCHIAGGFCLMSSPDAMAAVVIEVPHTQNAMMMDVNCADQLTPSTERVPTPGDSAVVPVDPASLFPTQNSLSTYVHSSIPQKLGLPLYTLLSNFRI